MKRWKWALGIVLAVALAAGLWYGCTPTTASLVTPGKDVNRAEFLAEAEQIVADHEAMQRKIAAGDAELDAQEARNAAILSTAVEIAGSAVNLAVTGQATAGSVVGLGIMGALGGAWTVAKRRAKNGDAVGGVVVRAVDTIRKNPEMQGAFEAALKDALTKSGLSEADYDKAIAKLKAENVAA